MNEGIKRTELEMLACFGVEPHLLDPTSPWCYNDAVYEAELDGFTVSFAVAPSYMDVRIIVRLGERRVFEFNSKGVQEVRVIDEPGIDAVEITLAQQSWLRMHLRPRFTITQGLGTDSESSTNPAGVSRPI